MSYNIEKRHLYNQQQGKCYYCKEQMLPLPKPGQVEQSDLTPTFDHKILKKNGGLGTIMNGVCACRSCNLLRSSITFNVFVGAVYDQPSKQAFIQAKNDNMLRYADFHEWEKKYPSCTMTLARQRYEALHSPQPIKQVSPTPVVRQLSTTEPLLVPISRKKRKLAERLANNRAVLASQHGKCLCCGTHTLDFGRTYDDLTLEEFKVSVYRPMRFRDYVACKGCYDLKRNPNKLLTFFRNLLK